MEMWKKSGAFFQKLQTEMLASVTNQVVDLKEQNQILREEIAKLQKATEKK